MKHAVASIIRQLVNLVGEDVVLRCRHDRRGDRHLRYLVWRSDEVFSQLSSSDVRITGRRADFGSAALALVVHVTRFGLRWDDLQISVLGFLSVCELADLRCVLDRACLMIGCAVHLAHSGLHIRRLIFV